MSSPPPTKPPRGVKQGKETSGLLMSVIRTLSASETNEQREKERVKLEKEYKKSDARLDELVAAHEADLTEVMSKYGVACDALAAWGVREEAARARLAACQGLLRVRRDDLRRLWGAARTHHHALDMLTRIERVVGVEAEARASMAAGHVLAAADTLATAMRDADTLSVPALSGTVQRLRVAESDLVEQLHRALCMALFAAPSVDLQRQGSTKRRIVALLAELTKSEEVTDANIEDITPELESRVSVEERSLEVHVTILLEALATLGVLREATEKFKVCMQSELLEVVSRVSRSLQDDEELDSLDMDVEPMPELALPLLETPEGRTVWRLLWRLQAAWRGSGARLQRAEPVWRAALQRRGAPATTLHTLAHYWSAVQQVMQLVVSEYVGMEAVRGAGGAAAAAAGPAVPLAEYFGKRRAPVRRRARLYRLQERAATAPGPEALSRAQRYPMLVPARAELLTVALPPLRALVTHIEKQAGGGGGACPLRVFVSEYVRGGGAARAGGGARAAVDATAGDVARWADHRALDGRKLYTCAVSAWEAVGAAAAWTSGAAWWGGGGGALQPALATLHAHATAAHAARLPAPRASHAARWLADDDIVRFLRNLPNWRAATATAANQESDTPAPQELEQAYAREAEILGASLGDADIRRADLLRDPASLLHHALMCETMEWLCEKTRGLIPWLARHGKLPDGLPSELEAAALRFQDLAHKCLLFLHLEVRIQCFYYLAQEEAVGAETVNGVEGAGGGGSGESGAARLAAALLALHDQVAPVLATRRLQYVVCGVGEMMSAGVVWRGRGAGGEVALLRHALAALGVGGGGLARAHAYLALLAAHPRDLVAEVRARGPTFSELEYLNAIKHIAARRRLPPAEVRAYLDQLERALSPQASGTN